MVDKKASIHYVDNKLLFKTITEWQKKLKENSERLGCTINELLSNKEYVKDRPPLPDYVAESMLKIANRLSQKARFNREDMVGDAMESCLRYIHNFNAERSNNAFAYITQIVNNAFIRRMQKEQKQLYVKMKIVNKSDFLSSYEKQEGDGRAYMNNYVAYLQEHMGDIITKFETWKEAKKAKTQAKKNAAIANVASLDEFIEVPESLEESIDSLIVDDVENIMTDPMEIENESWMDENFEHNIF